jgi:hypothetical protein
MRAVLLTWAWTTRTSREKRSTAFSAAAAARRPRPAPHAARDWGLPTCRRQGGCGRSPRAPRPAAAQASRPLWGRDGQVRLRPLQFPIPGWGGACVATRVRSRLPTARMGAGSRLERDANPCFSYDYPAAGCLRDASSRSLGDGVECTVVWPTGSQTGRLRVPPRCDGQSRVVGLSVQALHGVEGLHADTAVGRWARPAA